MTTHYTASVYHLQTQKFFEQIANRVARQTRFVQRRSPLDGRLFLLSLVLTAYQHGQIVLEQLAATTERLAATVQLTGQAFKARMNAQAVVFLQAMLVEALHFSLPDAPHLVPVLSAFSAVYLLDSSVIALPETLKQQYRGCGGGGAQASAKLFLLLNYLTGAYESLRIEAGRKADQNMGEGFVAAGQAQALWLFDLGFFKLDFLAAISQAKSYFLCRLYSQLTLYVRSKAGAMQRFDVDQFLPRAPHQAFEVALFLGPQATVEARLIVARVAARVAAERRRKLREKARQQGRTPRQTTLRRLDWTLLITNTRAAQVPTTTALEVYGVRWQVELAFKLAKSDLGLSQTRAREPYRVECEFYAKLIGLLLFNRLSCLVASGEWPGLSAVKAFRRLRADVEKWQAVLGQGEAREVEQVLEFLVRRSQATKRKKYRSTVQRLQASASEGRTVKLTNPLSLLEGPSRKPTSD